MDGAQVRVLKQLDQKGLGGLLQGQDCVRLPPEALVDGADAECDLAHQAGKGKLAHKQVGALLVTPDLAQSEGARAIASRLLLWDRVASCFVKRGIGVSFGLELDIHTHDARE